MRRLVLAVFQREESARGAVSFLRRAGYTRGHITLMTRPEGGRPRFPADLSPSVNVLGLALKGALWGSLVVFLASLPPVLLLPLSLPVRVFLLATMWKLGTFVGAIAGGFVGMARAFPDGLEEWGERHVPPGGALLAVKALERHLPMVRGVLIESGASYFHETQVQECLPT